MKKDLLKNIYRIRKYTLYQKRQQSYVRNEAADQVFESIDEQYTNKYEPHIGEITTAPIKRYDNIEPLDLEEPKHNKYIKSRLTSTAYKKDNVKKAPSDIQNTYDNDTLYSLYKESLNYNEFSSMIPIDKNKQLYTQNIWTKNYIRDAKGEGVLPKRFEDIDIEEFRKYMHKADHHFFAAKVPPKLRLYRPQTRIGWDDEVKLSTNVNENDKKDDTNLQEDEEIENTINEQKKFTFHEDVKVNEDINNIKNENLQYSTDKEFIDQKQINNFIKKQTQNVSLRVQRIMEWQKFLMRMRYIQKQATKRVTCVRAIGRINQFVVLFLMGDGEGYFTYGIGKASDRRVAYRRAQYNCRNNVMFIPLFEKRTFFQDAYERFGRSHVRIYGLPRGSGQTCSQRYLPWLRAVGVIDGGMKLSGTKNLFNVMNAFIKCLEKQRSYREIAFSRGVDYRRIRSPYLQTPPRPSPQEIEELERQAQDNLHKSINEVMKKRGLLYTRTFEPLQTTFLNYDREMYKEAWDKHLDKKNVPHGLRLYPSFSDFVDASTHIASIPIDPTIPPIPNPDRPRRDIFGVENFV